jgi:hypothetical protein
MKGQRYLMVRYFFIFFILTRLWAGFFPVFSQTGEDALPGNGADWVVPGGMSLSDQLLLAQALVPDIHAKLRVIEELKIRARAGGVSPADRNAVRILQYLAEEGILTPPGGRRIASRNFPEARRASCEVLGYIGGKEAKDILISVLKTDNEPMVLSEAVFALGKIETAPDKELVDILASLIEKKILISWDNNFAYALLAAVEKLTDTPAGIHDETLFRGLIRMLDAPLAPQVKIKTRRLIEKMKGF